MLAPVHLCLFEDKSVPHLYPLALTRTAGDLRIGARTLIECQVAAFAPAKKLLLWTRSEVGNVTKQEHPGALVNALPVGVTNILLVNQQWLVREGDLLSEVRDAAQPGNPERAWKQGETLLAAWLPDPPADLFERTSETALADAQEVEGEVIIQRLWDLIKDVPERVAYDVAQMGGLGKFPARRDGEPQFDNWRNVHIAPNAMRRQGAVFNAEDGAIHIAAGATVEENAVIRGPVFVGQNSVIKTGARIEGSAIGPGCKVGGEVHGSIIHSYSNKAHDGYLGNSYIGRWCNLGADTNTSNLKNDYGEVSIYDAVAEEFMPSGRQFAGLFMGDHSKCSINSMFNTGTVVGVFCNLFGSGFQARHIPSFSWGSPDVTYQLDKALSVAETVMARRGVSLTEADRNLLAFVIEQCR